MIDGRKFVWSKGDVAIESYAKKQKPTVSTDTKKQTSVRKKTNRPQKS